MATVLNRTTKQLIASADTPQYPVEHWIHSPDLSAVTGQPAKYWTISGDTVSLMDEAARDAVDAAEAAARVDGIAGELQQTENITRAFMLLVLDDRNATAAKLNSLLDAIDAASSLANLKTAVAAIANLPTYDETQLRTAIKAKLGS